MMMTLYVRKSPTFWEMHAKLFKDRIACRLEFPLKYFNNNKKSGHR